VCPLCNRRRMVETAAHLCGHVFQRLPVRQWALSAPKRLRYLMPFRVNLPHGREMQGLLGVRSLLLRSILRLVRLNGLSVDLALLRTSHRCISTHHHRAPSPSSRRRAYCLWAVLISRIDEAFPLLSLVCVGQMRMIAVFPRVRRSGAFWSTSPPLRGRRRPRKGPAVFRPRA
jgi:hypothetical protein